MSNSPHRKNGWAKGLIHFHTDYSDGGASVDQAAAIAKGLGYDFLIITDHLQDITKHGKSIQQYHQDCRTASTTHNFPVIPGGELEVQWSTGQDFSEAHTLALDITPLQPLFITAPNVKPYSHWKDPQGCSGTVAAVLATLAANRLPKAASHQFQHSYLGLGSQQGEGSDYRYTHPELDEVDLIDFFYSGIVDAAHESEDLALYLRRLEQQKPPAVYSSCDYHYGPLVLDSLFRQRRDDIITNLKQPLLKSKYRLVRVLGAIVACFPGLTLSVLRERLGPILRALDQIPLLDFEKEQLSHATYVHLDGKDITDANILAAIHEGRTCVTRGTATFCDFSPKPSTSSVGQSSISITLDIKQSQNPARLWPRSVIVFRDGDQVHSTTIPPNRSDIVFEWTDHNPPPGPHNYIVYVPSKFISSPVLVEVPSKKEDQS